MAYLREWGFSEAERARAEGNPRESFTEWPSPTMEISQGHPAENLLRKHTKSFTFSTGAMVLASQFA